MNKFAGFMTFAIGAAVGSAVTWYFLKDKYACMAQEEIDSVKATFTRLGKYQDSEQKEEQPASFSQEKPDITEYAKMLAKEGYTDYTVSEAEEKVKETAEKPYVIESDEFGEFDDYSQIQLTYYADHMLADENDELVEDVDNVIGFESLTRFNDEDTDVVLVRNDRLKTDFEICRDLRTYLDVVKTKPYLIEEIE